MKNETVNQEPNQKKIKIWRGKYIHLVNKDNDIKFRGPLSYRHLRIIGWLFLVISSIGVVLSIAESAGLLVPNETLITILKMAKSFMMPLFLFAAFAQVLVAKDGYKRLIITYVGGAVGIILAFVFLYLHFFVGIMSAASGSPKSAFEIGQLLIGYLNAGGGLSFNIFVDLALCTLVTFFINYRPTKYFQGKKMYIFRAFVALPILYELTSILLKVLVASEVIVISPFVLPFLTTKPPMAFFIFLAAALFVKNRERFYIKKGKTHEDYKEFLDTNVNSLHFSLFLVTAIIIAVVLDLFAFLGILVGELSRYDVNDPNFSNYIFAWAKVVYSWGFGQCLIMIFLVPIILLFDYKKTYKNKKIDTLIPIIGIALMLLVYVEGLFEVAKVYIIKLMNETNQEGGASEMAKNVIKQIASKFRK